VAVILKSWINFT